MPCKCRNDCVESDRRYYGCGYRDEYIGKASAFTADHIEDLSIGTCPQWWFAENQFVQTILTLVDDYDRGSLGNVLDLPSDIYDYLRIASNELRRWKSAAEKQLEDG